MTEPHPGSVAIPPGVRVERWPASLGTPAGCQTAVLHRGVIYASDVQVLRLAMGESIAVLDLDRFGAELLDAPLPMTTRPEPRQ